MTHKHYGLLMVGLPSSMCVSGPISGLTLSCTTSWKENRNGSWSPTTIIKGLRNKCLRQTIQITLTPSLGEIGKGKIWGNFWVLWLMGPLFDPEPGYKLLTCHWPCLLEPAEGKSAKRCRSLVEVITESHFLIFEGKALKERHDTNGMNYTVFYISCQCVFQSSSYCDFPNIKMNPCVRKIDKMQFGGVSFFHWVMFPLIHYIFHNILTLLLIFV